VGLDEGFFCMNGKFLGVEQLSQGKFRPLGPDSMKSGKQSRQVVNSLGS
jgi:hypothetical protein